jgi:hypothetical protein
MRTRRRYSKELLEDTSLDFDQGDADSLLARIPDLQT